MSCENHTTCLFTEGRVTLPAHYHDRTVNVFVPAAADAPAFNISRDTTDDGESLDSYITRQLALMAKHLKGWTQTRRDAAVLGDAQIQGECVHASYLRDDKRIWQQQAVFNTADRHILVFTMTRNAALTDADSGLFQALLASFQNT